MNLKRWRYKETSRRDGSCRDENVEVSMGVMRKDMIKNEYIRGTVKVERLKMKMREGSLRWYGHVMRRDQEYVGRRVMKMEYHKRGKDDVKENITGCIEGGKEESWCNRDRC